MVKRNCPSCGKVNGSADVNGTWMCGYCGAPIPKPEETDEARHCIHHDADGSVRAV